MPTIQLQLEEPVLEQARQLARARHISLEELISQMLGQLGAAAVGEDKFLGMLADEPELADQVNELAMAARERDSLRVAGGG